MWKSAYQKWKCVCPMRKCASQMWKSACQSWKSACQMRRCVVQFAECVARTAGSVAPRAKKPVRICENDRPSRFSAAAKRFCTNNRALPLTPNRNFPFNKKAETILKIVSAHTQFFRPRSSYLFAPPLRRSEFGSPTLGALVAPSSALKNGSSLKPIKPAVKTAGNELRAVLYFVTESL